MINNIFCGLDQRLSLKKGLHNYGKKPFMSTDFSLKLQPRERENILKIPHTKVEASK